MKGGCSMELPLVVDIELWGEKWQGECAKVERERRFGIWETAQMREILTSQRIMDSLIVRISRIGIFLALR